MAHLYSDRSEHRHSSFCHLCYGSTVSRLMRDTNLLQALPRHLGRAAGLSNYTPPKDHNVSMRLRSKQPVRAIRIVNNQTTGVTLTETCICCPPEKRITPSTGATSV